MNHLAHFYLAYPDTGLMAGGFLGDFVKGTLKGKLPNELEQGIRLHRAIDAFTDKHPIINHSRRRLDPEFRRYSGIICDICFDHLLARNWQNYSEMSLEIFSTQAYQSVVNIRQHAPEKAIVSINRMRAHAALESYQHEPFIDSALRHLSTQLSRDNPLEDGFSQFTEYRDELTDDFRLFMPEISQFVRQWIVNAE